MPMPKNLNEAKERLETMRENASVQKIEEIAREVIAGKWGVGAERVQKLTEAGFDAAAIQKCVNELMKK